MFAGRKGETPERGSVTRSAVVLLDASKSARQENMNMEIDLWLMQLFVRPRNDVVAGLVS